MNSAVPQGMKVIVTCSGIMSIQLKAIYQDCRKTKTQLIENTQVLN